MKTKEIRDLIEFIAGTGLNEVNIETEELKISVKRQPNMTTVVEKSGGSTSAVLPPSITAVPQVGEGGTTLETEIPAAPSVSPVTGAGRVEIKSPMIGTFYRSANPESEPYVSVGDTVSTGQTVCIVEAMKLFNEIESEVSGKIVEILVDDASPVEYDQPLFLVEPA